MPALKANAPDAYSFEHYLLVTRPRLWLTALSQAVQLPWTLLNIWKLVSEDCSPQALDRNLASFRAHREGLPDAHGHARYWEKARLADVGAHNVTRFSVWEMAWMMSVAMEIEDPIYEYSRQNREGFRTFMPALARFMGNSEESLASWCDSPWCLEERRHANTFARLIARITGIAPPRANPNRPMPVHPLREDALRLLTSRESAEWNSSSTYLVMAAHAAGQLHILIRNIARDEIKHLAILSSIDDHLLGRALWRRFARLVRQGLGEYRNHRRNRSAGHLFGTNPVTSFEVVICHLLVEIRLRRWLRRLPQLSRCPVTGSWDSRDKNVKQP